jgi:hypothetical protein
MCSRIITRRKCRRDAAMSRDCLLECSQPYDKDSHHFICTVNGAKAEEPFHKAVNVSACKKALRNVC